MEKLTTLDRAIRLQKVDLFSDLETDMLALAASVAGQVRLEAGAELFEQNGMLNALYVVLSGRVEMVRDGSTVFTVGPGETIGNWALFDRQPSVVTARAAEETWLLKIDRDDFFDLLSDHSEMARELFQALFKRVRSLLSKSLGSVAGRKDESAAKPD